MGIRHAADWPTGAKQVILANHLVQTLRTQPFSKRTGRLGGQAGGFKEIVHRTKGNRGTNILHRRGNQEAS